MLIAAGPDQQARAFLAPSICILCEQQLTSLQQGTRIVDTALDYWPVGHETSRLLGRKYVCEGCAHHVALALGYVTKEDFDGVMSTNAALESRVFDLKHRADITDYIQAAIDQAVTASTAPKE